VLGLDPSFAKYRLNLAAVERLATGFRWAEGPVWFGDGRFLLWSDIPNNRMMKWEEETGAVSIFRKPSNNTNGNTRDRQGRLVSCEHDARRVTRTEHDGTITVLADRYQGKPLNSPNDVVCKSDGSVWFSDPPFGILGNYEGHVATPELPPNVYRIDAGTGELPVATGDVARPNGLCFSPDESRLFVVVSGATPREIRVFDVVDGGTKLANGRVFVNAGQGIPEISGAAGAAVRDTTAWRSSTRPPSSSAASSSRSAALTSASAESSATGSSWRRASRCTRST